MDQPKSFTGATPQMREDEAARFIPKSYIQDLYRIIGAPASSDYDFCKSTPQRFFGVLNTFYDQGAKIQSDNYLSESARLTVLKVLSQTTLSQIDSLKDFFENHFAAAMKEFSIDKPIQNTQEELTYQTFALRFWERVKGVLDSGSYLDEYIARLTSLREIKVIREELPDYLATGAKEQFRYGLSRYEALLDERELELLPENEREEAKNKSDLQRGYQRVEHCYTQCRRPIASADVFPDPAILDWEDGKYFQLETNFKPTLTNVY